LGIGFPCFFEHAINLVALIVALLIISGLFNLATNLIANDCQTSSAQNACHKEFFTTLSVANKKNHETYLQIQSVLNFAAVIAVIGLLHFMRWRHRKLVSRLDAENLTPEDYTVKMENLPPGVDESRIIKFFESETFGSHIAKKVVFCYDIDHLVRAQRHLLENKKLQHKIAKLAERGRPLPANTPSKEEIDRIVEGLETLVVKLENETLMTGKFCNIAFVSFNLPAGRSICQLIVVRKR
jgi:hypothetical protein